MRLEKKSVSAEYAARLSQSPFFIVADYHGLKVSAFAELRNRLRTQGAEIHVVKNSIFSVVAKEAGVDDIGDLTGQLAVVTGDSDISGTAKILKTFSAEFEKPEVKFGYLDSQRLDNTQIATLADLPSLDVLRGNLLGTLLAPASQLARLLSTPATQFVRLLKAKMEKEG